MIVNPIDAPDVTFKPMNQGMTVGRSHDFAKDHYIMFR